MAGTRTLGTYVAAWAVVLMLGGCLASNGKNPNYPHDAPSGGQTIEEMEASIAALPGIESIETDGHDSLNIKGNTGRRAVIVVDPDFMIADGEALVTFLVESLWSVREGYMPNATLQLSITTNPADEFSIGEAAIAAEWKQPDASARPASERGWSSTQVDVSSDGTGGSARWGVENLERLGDWPGAVPDPPADAIIPRTN